MPQLGDGQIQRACASVELATAVTVPLVGALGTALTVGCPAQSVGLGAHQGVDERRQQFPQLATAGQARRSPPTPDSC
jgi:hypothetical protein